MLKALLFLTVGFIIGKMPTEFWAQARAEIAAGVSSAWESYKAWRKKKP